jgi:hypothetical protein
MVVLQRKVDEAKQLGDQAKVRAASAATARPGRESARDQQRPCCSTPWRHSARLPAAGTRARTRLDARAHTRSCVHAQAVDFTLQLNRVAERIKVDETAKKLLEDQVRARST